MSYPLMRRVCMGTREVMGRPGMTKARALIIRIFSEFGWIATISKPRFRTTHQVDNMGRQDLEPAMTDHSFAIFDTAIGRCGIAWGPRGINAVQLPMSNEDKTRARIRQRYGDIAEAPPPAEAQSAIDGIVELLAGKPNDLSDVVLDLDGAPEFNRGVYA